MPKWDIVARMSKVDHKELKELHHWHLAGKINGFVTCLYYGHAHSKDSSKVNRNVYNMHALYPVHFCIYFTLDVVDEAMIMEQYWNEVGLMVFERCDFLDPDYRCPTWIGDEEWFTGVTSLPLS